MSFNKFKNKKITIYNLLISLLIINLISGNMGLLNPVLYRSLSFILLMSLVFVNIKFNNLYKIYEQSDNKLKKFIILGNILLISSSLMLFFYSNRQIWILQVSIFFIGLDLVLRGFENRNNDFFLISCISFIYSIFIITLHNVSYLFLLFHEFALSISNIISFYFNKVLLGPWQSGLWILISFIICSLVILYINNLYENREEFLLFIKSIFGLFLGWIIYILIHNIYSFFNILNRANSLIILFILNSLALLPLLTTIKEEKISITIPTIHEIKTSKSSIRWNVAALCIILFFSFFFMTTFTPGYNHNEKINIALYKGIGVGNVDYPEYGNYGRYASGFFGLLPEYIDVSGYNMTIINDNLSQKILDEINVLIFINLNRELSNQNLKLVWDFVNEGGSLLVLGDHTDIGGIMNHSNRLIEPFGISYRFDSGIPIKSSWESSYYFMHHPINEGIYNNEEVGISVGATLDLELSKSCFPIIIGQGAFSDRGDYQNDAFLGDYDYNSGEQFGDLILVAGAYYGGGKVVVFGDTSSFQNIVLTSTHPFINNVFSWLTSSNTEVTYCSRILLSMLFLCSVFFIYKKLNKKYFILLPIILCFSIISSTTINSATMENFQISGSISYVDISHGERLNNIIYEEESISGLMINFARNTDSDGNRILPLTLKEFSVKNIFNSKILTIIAPTKYFDQYEIDIIERYVYNGGLLILSVGYNDKDASDQLLNRFGFKISSEPLGPVPYIEDNPDAYRNEPKFVDAWPVIIKNNNNSYISFYSMKVQGKIYDLVLFKKFGYGGVLVIGDSKFLLNNNLESLDDYWMGNIIFIKNILNEMKQEGVL